MIDAKQLFAAIHQHQSALPPGAVNRWSFLVTFDEMTSLVDELQADSSFGMQMDASEADDIKAGRAALFINGTMVIPELIERGNEVTN
jgi:hypothetical protein